MSDNSNAYDNSNESLGGGLGKFLNMDEEEDIKSNYRTVDKYFDFKVFINSYYNNNNKKSEYHVVAHMRHTPLVYKGQIIPVNNVSDNQMIMASRNVINSGDYQLSFIKNTDGSELLFQFNYGSMFGVPLTHKITLVNELRDSLDWFGDHSFDKIKNEHETLKANHDTLYKECNELSSEYAKLKKEHETLKASHNNLNSIYDDLRDEIDELKVERDELRAERDELKDNYDDLKSAVKNLQDVVRQLI